MSLAVVAIALIPAGIVLEVAFHTQSRPWTAVAATVAIAIGVFTGNPVYTALDVVCSAIALVVGWQIAGGHVPDKTKQCAAYEAARAARQNEQAAKDAELAAARIAAANEARRQAEREAADRQWREIAAAEQRRKENRKRLKIVAVIVAVAVIVFTGMAWYSDPYRDAVPQIAVHVPRTAVAPTQVASAASPQPAQKKRVAQKPAQKHDTRPPCNAHPDPVQAEYLCAVYRIEDTFPALNPDSSKFDVALTARVSQRIQQSIASGSPAVAALHAAVRAEMGHLPGNAPSRSKPRPSPTEPETHLPSGPDASERLRECLAKQGSGGLAACLEQI